MLDAVRLIADEFRQAFRIVDALDIAFVSVVLYAGLVWFKRTATRGVLFGVASLVVVYFAARALDMYLTSLAFQASFAVLLVVLVVVFQEDLRRMFERLSEFQPVRFRQPPSVDIDVDGVVETSFELASKKTGALIAIVGSEPLERHLNSGVALGGEFSRQLIYSIFDSHSAGHDGAVIIDCGRVQQFAVHLPISKNQKEIAGRGTRHSAALGLSERSDAFTIVVSEERGVVSVAESGRIEEQTSPAALKSRLERFLAENFPTSKQPTWTRLLFQHGYLKLLAVFLAVLAWVVLAYNPNTIQRTFVVPIEYRNLPKDLVLGDFTPNDARVTLSGSERNFRFLDPSLLKISANAANAREGFQPIPVTGESMRVPTNLSIYRIEPRTIPLYLQRAHPQVDSSDSRSNGKSNP